YMYICIKIDPYLNTDPGTLNPVIDPYLNTDPGTLNPVEHGECYVTDDVWNFSPVGEQESPLLCSKVAELDQDFGTYERFLNTNIHPRHNITSGQIFFEAVRVYVYCVVAILTYQIFF
ncbi:CTP synthase, partial [Kipferlia bialata]